MVEWRYMGTKFFEDDIRSKLWPKMELSIQKRAEKKDKKFILSGKWKKFVKKQDGFKIFAVDVEWIRDNVSIIFGHGGHGYVHEFIPLNEIWIATHRVPHFEEYYPLTKKRPVKFSQQYFDSAVIHEITEFKEMKKGVTYWKAHQVALKKEKEVGLVDDPSLVDFEQDFFSEAQ